MDKGKPALHAAALKGYDQVVQFLADHGANLEAKDKRGNTPLDEALGQGAGSGGFDGSRKDVHESTAGLLKKLIAKSQ